MYRFVTSCGVFWLGIQSQTSAQRACTLAPSTIHMREINLWSLVRRCPRPPQAALAALCLAGALVWGWTQAQTNLDKTQQLAMERYGQRAVDVVVAWRKLMDDSRSLSEPEKLAAVNAGIAAYEEALKANNKKYVKHVYPGTQHAFNNELGAAR